MNVTCEEEEDAIVEHKNVLGRKLDIQGTAERVLRPSAQQILGHKRRLAAIGELCYRPITFLCLYRHARASSRRCRSTRRTVFVE